MTFKLSSFLQFPKLGDFIREVAMLLSQRASIVTHLQFKTDYKIKHCKKLYNFTSFLAIISSDWWYTAVQSTDVFGLFSLPVFFNIFGLMILGNVSSVIKIPVIKKNKVVSVQFMIAKECIWQIYLGWSMKC